MPTVDWDTGIITVPQAELTFIGNGQYEHDIDQFRLDLRTLEASQEGAVYTRTHDHNTEVLLAGVTYARFVEVLAPYSIEYEDGQYTVIARGANHNIADVLVQNQVSLVTQNSAGLISPVGQTQETHMSVAYDDTVGSEQLELLVWLTRNKAVTLPTSFTVVWREPGGATVFTQTEVGASLSPQNVYSVTVPVALAESTPYEVQVTVVDAVGAVTTIRSVVTS